jgi:hypothetical protein
MYNNLLSAFSPQNYLTQQGYDPMSMQHPNFVGVSPNTSQQDLISLMMGIIPQDRSHPFYGMSTGSMGLSNNGGGSTFGYQQ